jgi:hypothetical protein
MAARKRRETAVTGFHTDRPTESRKTQTGEACDGERGGDSGSGSESESEDEGANEDVDEDADEGDADAWLTYRSNS